VERGGAEAAGDDGAGHVSAAEDDEEGLHAVTVDAQGEWGTVILGKARGVRERALGQVCCGQQGRWWRR
jgi:hypothetical protein